MVVGASTTAARAAVARRYAALPSTRRRADATPLLHRRALAVNATASAAESESAGVPVATVSLALKAAVSSIPHPEKVDTGGEDAWFISQIGGGAIGVSDGVGGWRESGVNPGDYSKFFMKEACAYIEGEGSPKIDPLGALAAGHDKTRLPGSATAVVLQLDADASKLIGANLGDSGFSVIRNGKVVFQSEPLQHFFDCPYQFGACPEFVELTDSPTDAQEYKLSVKPGDVVVMASDGLWDNCFSDEIASIVDINGNDLEKAAAQLAKLARMHAEDEQFESPYINAAVEEGINLPWWEQLLKMRFVDGKLRLGRLTGGKMDDITVVVAQVQQVGDSE
mmetsp:Transcript_22895/g.40754  ORF Transcript_22895/g.40754 Transcript_22895/m.40754 type:complete len:337 (-) Transcript_22895:252-1262(-)